MRDLKKQSLSEFLVFSRKGLIQKDIWKNVAIICNISYTKNVEVEVEVVTEDSYNFFTFYLLWLYTLLISLEIKFF